MPGRDGIVGLICLAASLVLLALTRGLPGASLLVPVGPGFYPRIVLGITAVFSVLLVFNDYMSRRRSSSLAASPPAAANHGLVLLTFTVVGIYVAALPFFGYRIATFVFVIALQALLEPPHSGRRWLLVLTVALATAATTYIAFEHYLSVLLPRGRWTDW